MAKSSGLGAQFHIAASNLTGDITALDRIGGGPALLDTTSIGVSGMERIGGKRDGAIEVSSWFNPAVGFNHDILSALPTADVQVTYCHRGTLGAPAVSCIGKQVNYDGTRGNDGAFTFKTSVQSNGYGIEWGHLLTTGAQTSSGAGNLTGYEDAAAATDFGLQLYVHLLAFTGTSVTVTVQDSNDDGGGDAYAAVTGATSGALSAVGTIRVATGATENVKQWLRVNLAGTYTNAQLVVVVVRNLTAPAF